MIEKRIGKNTANKRVTDTFAPRLIGARVGSENYSRIMDEESSKQRNIEKTTKVIDSIIDKLLRDGDDDDFSTSGFINEIVGKIRSRIPQKPKSRADLPSVDENDEK